MGIGSWWHWLIVLIVVLVLFGGGGKIPRLMGDLAKGIKSFKSGMKDDKPEDEAGTTSGEAPKRVAEGDRPSTTGQEKNAANG